MSGARSIFLPVHDGSLPLSQTERRVATYIAANRHQVLVMSAMELARTLGTSDATVIRTAKALGFDGLDALRRAIADDLKTQDNPAERITQTIRETGGDLKKAFEDTQRAQIQAIEAVSANVPVDDYIALVTRLAGAREIVIFGIGPTSALAVYFATQLTRFGLRARAVTATGLLLADQLLPMENGDLLFIMAYGRVYSELDVLVDHAGRVNAGKILVTDTLESQLGPRVDMTLTIPRGKTDAFSMHTATLAFIEAIIVGLATFQPKAAIEKLELLNLLRSELAGDDVRLMHRLHKGGRSGKHRDTKQDKPEENAVDRESGEAV